MPLRRLFGGILKTGLFGAGIFLLTFIACDFLGAHIRSAPRLEGPVWRNFVVSMRLYERLVLPVVAVCLVYGVIVALVPGWKQGGFRQAVAILLAPAVPLSLVLFQRIGANPLMSNTWATTIATLAFGLVCAMTVAKDD